MIVEETGFVSAPLLTVGEAARYLGVGRRVVYQLIEYGQIRAVKARGSVLVEQRSLDKVRELGIMP